MAHFARLNENNVVVQVIVVDNKDILDDNGVEKEHIGTAYCERILGGHWKQTSYNGNFRKNFAGQGYVYDSARDAFIPPQPFASWILDEDTCQWQAPTPHPDDGERYFWNEHAVSWQKYGS